MERVPVLESMTDPLAADGPNVVRNLMNSPKKIASVYVYDRRGTEFFERQCETPEYYLRRAEAALLRRYAEEIAALSGFAPIVELGAGTAEKTRILIAAYERSGRPCSYVAIDVDRETVEGLSAELASDFPGVRVQCLAASYEAGLCALGGFPVGRLFVFLGGSIGNMELSEMEDFLSLLFRSSRSGEYLLLGADLDKDPSIIDRAYNDAAGYGARSTLNMLSHLNHRYGADFELDRFRYRSAYDAASKRNVVRIESLVGQTVKFTRLDFSVVLEAGELIDAEVMWKFDPDELVARLNRVGFATVGQWIEPEFRYGLFLFRRG